MVQSGPVVHADGFQTECYFSLKDVTVLWSSSGHFRGSSCFHLERHVVLVLLTPEAGGTTI